MNPIRAAADFIHAAEKRTPGLSLRMDVSHKNVHITGRFGEFELARSVSWEEIDSAIMNPLTIHVASIENELTSVAAA